MESAGIPQKLRTKLLLRQLTEASDEERKEIIEQAQLIGEELRMQRPTSRDESSLTESVSGGGVPKSAKEFVGSLHVIRE